MVPVLVMFILFVLFPAVVGAAVVNAKKAKAGGEEMRLSDLERLIEAAVEDATGPLVRRIETLEAIVTDDDPAGPARQPGRIDPAALADALGETEDAEGPAAVRRRARS